MNFELTIETTIDNNTAYFTSCGIVGRDAHFSVEMEKSTSWTSDISFDALTVAQHIASDKAQPFEEAWFGNLDGEDVIVATDGYATEVLEAETAIEAFIKEVGWTEGDFSEWDYADVEDFLEVESEEYDEDKREWRIMVNDNRYNDDNHRYLYEGSAEHCGIVDARTEAIIEATEYWSAVVDAKRA